MSFPKKTPERLRQWRLKVIRPVYKSLSVPSVIREACCGNAPVAGSWDVPGIFSFLENETRESFWAVHLNAKNEILCLDQVSVGSLTASLVHPRDLFKSALLSSAAAIIFVHNHPSGNPEPSREDLELQARLVEAGELLGITVLDHVIIGGQGKFLSLAEIKK